MRPTSIAATSVFHNISTRPASTSRRSSSTLRRFATTELGAAIADRNLRALICKADRHFDSDVAEHNHAPIAGKAACVGDAVVNMLKPRVGGEEAR
jgi:hypothetical protein